MSLHQEIIIKAAPEVVYATLLGSEAFSEMSGGARADISTVEGGLVSLFDGQIQGRNLELVDGVRIVQSWRAVSWGEGCHSIVRFDLKKEGRHTKVILDQSGFPEGTEGHLEKGWHDMYWAPLKAQLSA